MTIQTIQQAIQAQAEMTRRVAEAGIRIEFGDDFSRFKGLKLATGTPAPSPVFDPSLSDLTPDNAFWVAGFADGVVVHVQAFWFNTYAVPLGDAFEPWLLPLYDRAGAPLKPAPDGVSLSPQAREIRGRVAYHGELVILPSKNGVRNRLSTYLPQIGMMAAYLMFQPDYIYGWISERMALTGMATRCGYRRIEEGALCWADAQPDANIPSTEWIAWLSRPDMEHLARMFLRG